MLNHEEKEHPSSRKHPQYAGRTERMFSFLSLGLGGIMENQKYNHHTDLQLMV